MNKFTMWCFFTLMLQATACYCQNIDGLWLVDQVLVNAESMTPQAKWIRFHQDGTQESGNGWRQHSIGTYTFSKEDEILQMQSLNGLKDLAEPFEVTLRGDSMFWNRNEEGAFIEVKLTRVQELPAAPVDKLLGLWELMEIIKHEDHKAVAKEKPFIYLGWDNRFRMRNINSEEMRGVYQVHGHKPEIRFYGRNKLLFVAQFEMSGNNEVEMLLDGKTFRYKRIYEFPD